MTKRCRHEWMDKPQYGERVCAKCNVIRPLPEALERRVEFYRSAVDRLLLAGERLIMPLEHIEARGRLSCTRCNTEGVAHDPTCPVFLFRMAMAETMETQGVEARGYRL